MGKVSVVIPAYHAGPFLQRTLDSVAAQTFRDYEVILAIDDPGYDDSLETVKAHPLLPRITTLPSAEKGNPAMARNRAVRKAGGYYLAFLDADDEWDPEKLEKQVGILERDRGVDLVYTAVRLVNDGTGEVTVSRRGQDVPLWRRSLIAHSSVMVRTAKGIPAFDERLGGADDYKWLLDAEERGFSMRFLDEVLVSIHIHGANITTGNLAGSARQMFRVHRVRGRYGLAFVNTACLILGHIPGVSRAFYAITGLKRRILSGGRRSGPQEEH
jgi:teichuronic acid biosynthesis glycosyltransferase TuaG